MELVSNTIQGNLTHFYLSKNCHNSYDKIISTSTEVRLDIKMSLYHHHPIPTNHETLCVVVVVVNLSSVQH